MKKVFLKIVPIMVLALFAGCSGGGAETTDAQTTDTEASVSPTSSEPSETAQDLTVGDYFPLDENTLYTYEGEGNEYASYTAYTDYITDNLIQRRIDNGGTVTAEVVEVSENQILMVVQKSECYYRENMTTGIFEDGEVLLKAPLAVGTSWTLYDGSSRYISDTDVQMTTLAGTFSAVEVTTESDSGLTKDYYAPGVGLVKTVYTSEGTEVSSVLSSIESNVPLTQSIRFYYPNIDDEMIYYVDKQISFYTNDITRTAIEEAYKELPDADVGRVLSENAKIKSLYLNNDGMVYADFSQELISEMNAGSGYEAMILQCITNTMGGYYGVDEVYITVEGEPYSSGHIEIGTGEAFTVDFDNCTALET